ncbi:MAG: hypothetical protein ACOYKZ_02830 [Chlamydiia bacterium]
MTVAPAGSSGYGSWIRRSPEGKKRVVVTRENSREAKLSADAWLCIRLREEGQPLGAIVESVFKHYSGWQEFITDAEGVRKAKGTGGWCFTKRRQAHLHHRVRVHIPLHDARDSATSTSEGDQWQPQLWLTCQGEREDEELLVTILPQDVPALSGSKRVSVVWWLNLSEASQLCHLEAVRAFEGLSVMRLGRTICLTGTNQKPLRIGELPDSFSVRDERNRVEEVMPLTRPAGAAPEFDAEILQNRESVSSTSLSSEDRSTTRELSVEAPLQPFRSNPQLEQAVLLDSVIVPRGTYFDPAERPPAIPRIVASQEVEAVVAPRIAARFSLASFKSPGSASTSSLLARPSAASFHNQLQKR